jgi:uncharacterized protein (DUF1697 family)
VREPLRLVALLRGVNNIGSTHRVSMADLRGLVEGLGCQDVTTLLNSGNVVFSAPRDWRRDAAARIETELASSAGVACQVAVLSRDEVATALRANPFAGSAVDPSRLLVVVPRRPHDLARLEPLLGRRWGREALALGRRVAYVWCAQGVAESALWPAVDRTLERSGTARNLRTMKKILAALEQTS